MGNRRGTVEEWLLHRAELAVLAIPPEEAERARAVAEAHDMVRDHALDFGTSVVAEVERFAAERDRPAVTDAGRTLSYAGLAAEARRLATLLRTAGVTPGSVVGVGGERGATVVAAFLAMELIGAVYVPADTTWPADRIRAVLAQAGADVLLTVDPGESAPGLLEGAHRAGCRVVCAAHAAACEPWSGPPPPVSPEQPRYVLFTSGSTGRPKGAVVEQRGMINHLYTKIVDFGLTEADVVAQLAPLGFDVSIWQMLCALLAGGRVVVLGDDVGFDPPALRRAIRDQGITVVEVVPVMLRDLVDHLEAEPSPAPDPLRWMISNGEELHTGLARRWIEAAPDIALVNAYGPTECSDDVTHQIVTAADLVRKRLPIGSPITNCRLYILREDEEHRWIACAAGEEGQLFIGGDCVGRGYLGDPERTRAAFFQDPFEESGTGRLYRTGDAVKLLPPLSPGAPHTLQYVDRVDRQVKISGARAELGEIEAVLQRHPDVGAVTVVVHEFSR